MMVQSKIKVKENDENGVGSSNRRRTAELDHWDFLEEIEAPMWADLTLETKLISEDNDDAWFNSSHLFHYHSARRLRSTFAHSDMGNDLFNFCSPKFPSSVSKSRGKDYRSRDWKSNCRQISFDKDHPVNDLGDRISITNTVSSQECKLKVSHDHQSEASSSITSVVLNSKRTVALNSQSASTSGVSTSTITTVSMQQDSKILDVSKEAFGQTGDLLNALRTNLRKSRATRPSSRVEISQDREPNSRKSSAGKSSVGSSSTGYDTEGKGFAAMPKTDHCKQVKVEMNVNIGSKGHKTLSEIPNQRCSNPKFEVKKIATDFKQNKDRNLNVRDLGKSTKPVNGRVMTKKLTEASDFKQNKDRNLSGRNLGKSTKPVNGRVMAKKMTEAADFKQNKDRNLSVRDLGKSSKPVNGRVIAKKMTEASVCTKDTFSSKIESKDTAAASRSQATSKSKVLLQTTQKNSLNRSRTGAQGVKGTVGNNHFNKGASSGKENMKGRVVLSHRSTGKDNKPVVRVSDQKPKVKSESEVGVTSISSKVRIGRMNDGIMPLDTRVHLR